jgi:2-succinyl-5-enolpyruvyl-6-hydroxy-3-cyclohexene-1-carboxylate synthase
LDLPSRQPHAAPEQRATANLDAALRLLQHLRRGGLAAVVLCPGSRSAPLALAAGLLARAGLPLHTAIDERSAGFLALGLVRAGGRPVAVITTSGTAVANLLPAAVEADLSALPLLLLSADRPERLKGCGANQTVAQELFLLAAARWCGRGAGAGLDGMPESDLLNLADQALSALAGTASQPPGPVHLNLPFEEPLHADGAALLERVAAAAIGCNGPLDCPAWLPAPRAQPPACGVGGLDPDRPGVVVAGPWRGLPQHWPAYRRALRLWLARTGWPLLADGLSGLRGQPDLQPVGGYDLLLADPPPELRPAELQVLRLGPLPASRRLQAWLAALGGPQLLISEADPRCLDPLGTAQLQWPGGLAAWWQQLPAATQAGSPAAASLQLTELWQRHERCLQGWLDRQLALPCWGEPAVARALSRLLPADVPLLLANSSPVRDWESFAVADGPPRPVYGFRGASGIDGTLSQAFGVAAAAGQAVLLSGDLALLHDSNGWLWARQLLGQRSGQLTVVLLDNGGGGIFEQLPIRTQPETAMDFEQLFAMGQQLDQARLAACHGVPSRRVERADQLAPALIWALEQPLALLHLITDRRADAERRQALRRMAPSSWAR